MSAQLKIDQLIIGLKKGDKKSLSKCITLIESQKPEDLQPAIQILREIGHQKCDSKRIGITGPPGVGKSSFIEKLGLEFTKLGYKIAVLSVDPSSSVSKGSILGDKTRMVELSKNENAFIRPTAAGEHLGGVSTATQDTILLCEAAGYDLILIETVGVGQSEIEVSAMVDMTILLALPGAGDDLQGIKKGLMEHADLFVVHKYDGDLKAKANKTAEILTSILRFLPKDENKPEKKVLLCSSLESANLDLCLHQIQQFFEYIKQNNYLYNNRNKQVVLNFRNLCAQKLWHASLQNNKVKLTFDKTIGQLRVGEISSREALNLLINDIFAILKSEK